jgi:uncharacterized protein (DUF486 family)
MAGEILDGRLPERNCKRKPGKEHQDCALSNAKIECRTVSVALFRIGTRIIEPTTERTTRRMKTIALLTISNIFMTFAWYGHLKYRDVPLFKVIVVSWMIAFFEYCFQVPANRIGSYEFSAAQLKTIQEVITLTVFAVFSVLYLKQPLRWNYFAGFALIVAAVAVIFKK